MDIGILLKLDPDWNTGLMKPVIYGIYGPKTPYFGGAMADPAEARKDRVDEDPDTLTQRKEKPRYAGKRVHDNSGPPVNDDF